MIYKNRLADKFIRNVFPLKVEGEADWLKKKPNSWEITLELPEIPADHIIVPSYCSLSNADQHQFVLCAQESLAIYPVPSPRAFRPSIDTQSISGEIDCWYSKTVLENASVLLEVQSDTKPSNYLITLTIRELIKDYNPSPNAVATTQKPRLLSQMTADRNLRDRICSPTATAMALSTKNQFIDWSKIIEQCYDPATKAYGSWPLAINSGSKHNFIGCIEAVDDWEDAVRVLQTGQPLVCSIRFSEGDLSGSPLKKTSGHLVCLYGIEHNKVLVLDPAGKTEQQVDKSYDLEQFSMAWLRERGAVYFFHHLS